MFHASEGLIVLFLLIAETVLPHSFSHTSLFSWAATPWFVSQLEGGM